MCGGQRTTRGSPFSPSPRWTNESGLVWAPLSAEHLLGPKHEIFLRMSFNCFWATCSLSLWYATRSYFWVFSHLLSASNSPNSNIIWFLTAYLRTSPDSCCPSQLVWEVERRWFSTLGNVGAWFSFSCVSLVRNRISGLLIIYSSPT